MASPVQRSACAMLLRGAGLRFVRSGQNSLPKAASRIATRSLPPQADSPDKLEWLTEHPVSDPPRRGPNGSFLGTLHDRVDRTNRQLMAIARTRRVPNC